MFRSIYTNRNDSPFSFIITNFALLKSNLWNLLTFVSKPNGGGVDEAKGLEKERDLLSMHKDKPFQHSFQHILSLTSFTS